MTKDPKNRLRSQMLRVSRDVEASGGELVVTRRGEPVYRVLPFGGSEVEEVFGEIGATPVYYEDIDTPTVDEWPDLR